MVLFSLFHLSECVKSGLVMWMINFLNILWSRKTSIITKHRFCRKFYFSWNSSLLCSSGWGTVAVSIMFGIKPEIENFSDCFLIFVKFWIFPLLVRFLMYSRLYQVLSVRSVHHPSVGVHISWSKYLDNQSTDLSPIIHPDASLYQRITGHTDCKLV